MEPTNEQELMERKKLWESLRALQPEIFRLAAGDFNSTERERELVILMAKIVASEIDFQNRRTMVN